MKKNVNWMILSPLVLVALISLVATAFQNCDANFAGQVGQAVGRFSSLSTGADFSWVADDSLSQIQLNQYNRVKRWYDLSGRNIPLYPPLIPGSSVLDYDHSGVRIETQKGVRILLDEKSTLAPVVQDASALLSDQYSVLFFINNIKLPTSDPKVVRTFMLAPVSGEEAGIIVLDIYPLNETEVRLAVVQWFNPNSHAQNFIVVPRERLSGGFGFALRFGKSASQLSFAVNGELSSGAPVLTGTVPDMGYVVRQLSIRTAGYGDFGSFELADFGVFKSSLSDNQLKSYSLGLYKTYELGEEWDGGGGGGGGNPTSVTFADIKQILQKPINSTTCTGCHTGIDSRAGLVGKQSASGVAWVTVGNAAGSLLVKSLKQETGVMAMPQGGGRMNSDDVRKIESWIERGAP